MAPSGAVETPGLRVSAPSFAHVEAKQPLLGPASQQGSYAPACIRSGTASDQGRRAQMEDASVAIDDITALAAAAAAAAAGGGGGGSALGARCDANNCNESCGCCCGARGGGGGRGAAAGDAAAAAPAWLAAGSQMPSAAGFYAVFDGHCGPGASKFAASRAFDRVVGSRCFPGDPQAALTEAFMSIEQEYCASVRGGLEAAAGTTALAALVWGGSVVVANAGDSRAVLSRRGKAIELTTDHKPHAPAERSRIEQCGGFVCEEGLLCGELGVARAIGDWHFPDLKRLASHPGSVCAPSPLTAQPEVTEYVMEGPADEFIILGCDGLWDVFSSQRAVEFARQRLRRHNDPQRCAEELVAEALRMHSGDNLTVLVVCLGEDPPQARVYSGSALSANASRRASADGCGRSSEGAPSPLQRPASPEQAARGRPLVPERPPQPSPPPPLQQRQMSGHLRRMSL